MKAMCVADDGSLRWTDVATPVPGAGEVRVRVVATASNRADLLQREGRYPAPPGKSPIPGLECAGEIDALGAGVTGVALGDRVAALLAGGGHAEYATCPVGHLLPIPDGLPLEEAAALPEVLTTATSTLVAEAAARPGERVLVHAGGSGVGTCAIQLCRVLGLPCWVTAGSDDKVARCVGLGAEGGANRHRERFADLAREWTDGEGFDVILDPVGAATLDDDLRSLAVGGRLVVIGLLGGRTATLDLGRLLVKRLRIVGSVLRSRTDEEKTRLLDLVRRVAWPRVASGEIRPVIDRVLPLPEAERAYDALARNETFGKIVLTLP